MSVDPLGSPAQVWDTQVDGGAGSSGLARRRRRQEQPDRAASWNGGAGVGGGLSRRERQVFAAAGVTAAEAMAVSAHPEALDEVLDSCGVHALMDGIETLKERGAHPSIVAAAEAVLAW